MNGFTASGILGLLAEYALKTTVVLTFALLAAAVSRRRPAAFRHFLLSFALIGLLLLPVLSIAPVGWRTSLLPSRPSGTIGQSLANETQSPRLEATGVPVVTLSVTSDDPVERPSDLPADATGILRLESSAPPLSGAATSDRRPSLASIMSRGAVGIALAVLWSAGLIVLVLRLAFGLAGAVRLTGRATALRDPAWRILIERFLSLVPLRRRIRLKSHPEILVPLTWGWRKPVILMPGGTDAWTEEERSSALFHELSHVKRADFLVMLLVRTSLAVFWFNPLCWIVYRELRKEQEIACDELVLRAGIRPSIYAASLLAFRRSAGFRWNPSAALLGMLGRSSFHERLAAILKQKLSFKEVKMKTRIMLAAAVVLAVALIGTARPAVGIEKNAVTTTVGETAVPAPASFDIAPPAPAAQETQAEKAVAQEKKIVVKPKDGSKTPIEITITEGDTVKTLVLDKPLTITKDGDVLILSIDGKDIQVLKGEPLSLAIEGGAIEIMKEGKALKAGEGGAYKIFKEGEDNGGRFVVYRTKMDIAALEDSLKKLEAKLQANEEKLQELRVKIEKEGGEDAELDKIAEGKAGGNVVVFKKRIRSEEAEEAEAKESEEIKARVMAKEDGMIQIVLGEKGMGREAYDRAVAKLKKDLPDGYKLMESNFDEKAGEMTLEIAPPEGKKRDKELIRKLIASVLEEIDKK